MGTWASVVLVCGLSCLMTCEIFLDQVDPRFPALVGVFFTLGTPVEWSPYILALGNWRSSLLIAPKVSRTSETFCDFLFYLVFVSRTTGSYKLQWYLPLFSVASKLCHRAHEHTEAAHKPVSWAASRQGKHWTYSALFISIQKKESWYTGFLPVSLFSLGRGIS